jgi:cytochrome P450
MVLLMAGHEATVNATANGVAALATHPGEWGRMRSGDVAVDAVIEEVLRFDPPLQWFERWVLDDGVELGGVTVPKGGRVALVIGAANRDPARFRDPDRFDVRRTDASHLAFGGGIHFCIGAPLARMELAVTLGHLLDLAPGLELASPSLRRPTFQFRGFERLEVALGR